MDSNKEKEEGLDNNTNDTLSEVDRVQLNLRLKDNYSGEEKHDNVRIQLFRIVVFISAGAIAAFILTLIYVIYNYISFLSKGIAVPENYWHIPTLISFLTISILYSSLKFTAKFGDFSNRKIEDKTEGDLPITQIGKDVSKEVASLLSDALKTITKDK